MAKVHVWDDEFDAEYFTPKEIADSDAQADAITKQINDSIGHGGLLAFERSAVDA